MRSLMFGLVASLFLIPLSQAKEPGEKLAIHWFCWDPVTLINVLRAELSHGPKAGYDLWRFSIAVGECEFYDDPPVVTEARIKYGRVHAGPKRAHIVELWTFRDPVTGEIRFTGVIED